MQRMGILCAWAALLGLASAAAQTSEGAAVLQAALEAHGGAAAVARSERAVYSGTWAVVRREGIVERSVVLHAGRGDAYRAEVSSPGLERLYVTDGEAAWVVENGSKRSLPTSRSANRLFPLNPLPGLFAALIDSRTEIGEARSEAFAGIEREVVEVLLPDHSPRSPRSRPLDRRYEVAIDPETGLVASLTLFTDRRSLLPDEPSEIYEYSDYRQVEGMAVPFLVQVLSGAGDLLFELRLEWFEAVDEDPDVEEP